MKTGVRTKKASTEQFDASLKDLETWLGTENIKGKRILDIGCGSRVHSFNFFRLIAKELTSFDYYVHSVSTTREFWEEAQQPDNWCVFLGSVLDEDLMTSLGTFDIVYFWGVLHHTGSMLDAIRNAMKTVADDGLFWIAIYHGVDTYESDLELKKRYNNASWLGKKSWCGIGCYAKSKPSCLDVRIHLPGTQKMNGAWMFTMTSSNGWAACPMK